MACERALAGARSCETTLTNKDVAFERVTWEQTHGYRPAAPPQKAQKRGVRRWWSDRAAPPPAPCRRDDADLSATGAGRPGLPRRRWGTFSPPPWRPHAAPPPRLRTAPRAAAAEPESCAGVGAKKWEATGARPHGQGAPKLQRRAHVPKLVVEGLRPARGGWPWVGVGPPGSRPAPWGGATNPLGLRHAAGWPTWCHGAPPHERRRSRVGGGCAPNRRGGAGGAGPKKAGGSPQKAPPPGAHASDQLVGPHPTAPACAGGRPSVPEPVARPPRALREAEKPSRNSQRRARMQHRPRGCGRRRARRQRNRNRVPGSGPKNGRQRARARTARVPPSCSAARCMPKVS